MQAYVCVSYLLVGVLADLLAAKSTAIMEW